MTVKPGQVWKDNDPRILPRTIIIQAVDSKYAYVFCKETKRKTRILLDRFNPNRITGYTLVKEAQE